MAIYTAAILLVLIILIVYLVRRSWAVNRARNELVNSLHAVEAHAKQTSNMGAKLLIDSLNKIPASFDTIELYHALSGSDITLSAAAMTFIEAGKKQADTHMVAVGEGLLVVIKNIHVLGYELGLE